MKKYSILLFTIIIIFILTSCTTDRHEVDDQVYTLVIGCDKGIHNKVRITVQFPTYKESGGSGSLEKKGGGSSEEISGTIVETIEASSILEGINLLNTATTRRISFVHTKTIIFSEVMAREGVKDYLQPIARFREARRIMQIIVCKGAAEDFIRENKTQIGESLAKAMELAASQSENNGYFPEVPFQEFYTAAISPYRQAFTLYAGINEFKTLEPESEESANKTSPLITEFNAQPGEIPRKGSRKIEFAGTAVFNGEKMVGSLTTYETRYFLMVTGRFNKGIFTIEDKNSPGDAIPLDLRPGRTPKIDAHFENGVPIINVKLSMEADLGAIQSRVAYEKLNKIKELNKYVESIIKEGVEKTIRKTQQEWNTDIFGFGKKIAHSFFTVTEFEQYNWLKHYKEAKVNVEVLANVRRTGLMMNSSKIRNNEETILSKEEK
ncbi:Ger(x)C family spore germination protein [Pseudobacteroides cellulosolvens]|uniref:Germination protein, Ger(X)C family n=1 Tax=Pseudobacteroides cellulosolvens ATCC 35603 = DSM 2933 TaxID=398512 RepID=A0A0L6JT20_9FIRM|nr:Ger(x)C family spore germination protein [Pseudobacteroides cellulosolvens]KNY28835.1 germination protein, Ger(x)C family [Pseudobacteroides cellulosolvens ATCC 35603 = DSM 2933]